MPVFRPFRHLIFIIFVVVSLFARNDGNNLTPKLAAEPRINTHPRVGLTPENDFPARTGSSKNDWSSEREQEPDFDDDEMIRTEKLVEDIGEFLRNPEEGFPWAFHGVYHPPGKSSRTHSKRFGVDDEEEDEEGVSSKQDGNGRPVFNPTGW